MRISRLVLMLVSVLLIGAIAAPVTAQGDPSMLAWITDPTRAQNRVVAIGDDLAGQELFNFAQADIDVHNVFISRDTQWVAMTVSNKADGVISVWYRHTGGEPVIIPNAQVTGFTPASTFLMYQWALFETFGVGIVNLSTGNQLEFIGTRTDKQGLNNGAAMPLYFDGNTLYAVGYLPFSDAPLYGLYSFDLAANVQDIATKSGRFDLPPAVAVTDTASYSYGSLPVVSPDGTHVAILATDPSNPATGMPEMPFAPTTNVLYVVDLATKAMNRLAQAGPGQLLLGLSWMSDSRGLVFAGGNYGSINTIYTASVEGNVQPLGAVGTGNVSNVTICGRYVYVTWMGSADSGTPKIQRALLNDLATLQNVGTIDTMQLLGCSA